jgi:hypothetical protein
MNIRLKAASVFLPPPLRRKKLNQLFRLTAQAFQSEMPDLAGLGLEECLHLYGVYTGEEAEKVLAGGDVQAVETRLFQNAYWLGKDFRRSLRPRTVPEIMTAAGILYKALGIEFRGDADGRIVIRSCFFSRYYSRKVCEFMSALDRGILSGLSDGGELTFIQRLTEGKDCCLAEFVFRDGTG